MAISNGEKKENPEIVLFGEMLIDFVPSVSGVSLTDAPGIIKAPGGAPANVACAITKHGSLSAFIDKGAKVLVKHGEKGSVLYVEGEEAIRQLPISTGNVLDKNGADDTFTVVLMWH